MASNALSWDPRMDLQFLIHGLAGQSVLPTFGHSRLELLQSYLSYPLHAALYQQYLNLSQESRTRASNYPHQPQDLATYNSLRPYNLDHNGDVSIKSISGLDHSISELSSGKKQNCNSTTKPLKKSIPPSALAVLEQTKNSKDYGGVRTKLVFPRRKAGQCRHQRADPVLLTASIIQQYSNLPIIDAASQLGISVTALKSACRCVPHHHQMVNVRSFLPQRFCAAVPTCPSTFYTTQRVPSH